jgi:predicted amidohydrolase
MSKVKISACQFEMLPNTTRVSFFSQLFDLLEEAPNDSDYVVFPEMLTLPLLFESDDFQNNNKLNVEQLGTFTEEFLSFFRKQAIDRKFYIIAGSHITNTLGVLENTCFVFSPDGTEFTHKKTHRTPLEEGWNIREADTYSVHDVGPAKIGLAICYEAEFPEVTRIYAEQGAQIIFVPTWTTTEHGFWRIRHSAQARCIENQIFVVQSCLVGNPFNTFKGGYGRSAIITPCDSPWTVNGIECETETNVNTVISAVLDLDVLENNRKSGYVKIYADYKRRTSIHAGYKPYSHKPFGSKRDDIINP